LVDITHCEVCGKTIPAIGQSCPYCERERGPQQRDGRPYLALALRLLLYLFMADVVSTMGLAVLTLLHNREGTLLAGTILLAALIRFLLGGATLGTFFFRESCARSLPLTFLGYEALGAVAVMVGWIPIDRWGGGLVAPLWNILFVFLFLRSDVKAYLDPRVADQQQLGMLLRRVEKGDRAEG
jgi:hypothetical protein